VGIPPVYTRFRARDSWTKVHVSPPRIGTGIETKLLLPITKMKTAIIVISDPKAGEEAAGRAFNALATAKDGLEHGDEIEIAFIGAGTRWPAEMSKAAHPLNALYQSVRDAVRGASRGCAVAFGATAGVDACGISQAKDFAAPGTPGILSVRRYLAEGWQTLNF
jgi:hypothetical protein